MIALPPPDSLLASVQHLPPPGRAFTRDTDTLQANIFGVMADTLGATRQAALDLINIEANPATTAQLLPDFEEEYGLPDPCSPLNSTLNQRRGAVLAAMAASPGGQSIAYYESVSAAMGYSITITVYHPFRLGISALGDPLCGPAWQFAWLVTVPDGAVSYFRLGESALGEPFWTLNAAELECRLNALKPANTVLIFA